MDTESILKLVKNRRAPEDVLKGLVSDDSEASAAAGRRLCNEARKYGLSLKKYLDYAIDPAKSQASPFAAMWQKKPTYGFDAALMHLGIPTQEDARYGITLDLAADTFQTYPGARVLFPDVLDTTLRWKTRIDNVESLEDLLANSTEISGTQMITEVVDNDESDTQLAAIINEGSRIPFKSIKTTQQAVNMFKVGMGWSYTYEFARRARLDILTPYAARALREAERSKIAHATDLLINGDGVNSAATLNYQYSYNSDATAGTIDWEGFLKWVVARAQAFAPIDTVVGNWDAYFQWIKMFAAPTVNAGDAAKDILGRTGVSLQMPALVSNPIKFVVSSTMSSGVLLGMLKNETLEELRESGSSVTESERLIQVQKVVYTRTENLGFRLLWGDTRSIYDYTTESS